MPLPTIQRSFYQCELPSSGGVVNYRPYLVKEEREILRASKSKNEKDSMNALRNLINACVQEEGFDCFTHPSFDIEYLFLQIRSKSVGEIVEFDTECIECKSRINTSVDISQIKPNVDKQVSKDIKITEQIMVQLRYPTFSDMLIIQGNEDNSEVVFDLAEILIQTVWNGEESFTVGKDFTKAEAKDFLNQLTEDEFRSIVDFIEKIPSLEHSMTLECPKCSHTNTETFRGISDFFG